MAHNGDGDGVRIGEILKQARTRQGLEIREVEERTKIRIKYLRALEAEDWEVLPSAAYAKGFLRTYAQLLRLDADVLVDEFRRQVEGGLEPENPLRVGEPVLEARRRPGDRPPSRFPPAALVVAGLVAAVGVLAVIGLVGGGDDGGERERRAAARQEAKREQRAERRQRERRERKRERREQARETNTVDLGLQVERDVQVCLLSGSGEVLIASQVLSPGTEERFKRKRFELRFPSGYDRGQFRLLLDGDVMRLPELSGPAAFAIGPGARPRQLDAPETGCP